MQPEVTIVIATRNRCRDVLRTVGSCAQQSYEDLEIIVYDDASSDGTAFAIAREFPGVRVCRGRCREGPVVLRNRGFREALGEIIFSIDDDAYFTCDRTVERIVGLFTEHPRVAAVALPYVEPTTKDPKKLMHCLSVMSPLRSFVGCAHALRRSAVLELGGYRDFFVHQGEERDLAIRLRDRGYEIVFGDSCPVVHTYSPKRDVERIAYYGVRNTLLFDSLNVPFSYLVPRIVSDALKLFSYKLTWKSAPKRFRYVVSGLGSCLGRWHLREPVSVETYRRYRELPAHGPLPLESLVNEAVDCGPAVSSDMMQLG